MPSGISGPGIPSGAGTSQIGAVSVGIYANMVPLQEGFAAAQGKAAVAGQQIGDSTAKGFLTSVKDEAHGLKGAVKGIHTILTAAGSFGLIYGAFKFGEEIGNAVFVGVDHGLEPLEKRVAAVGEHIASSLGAQFGRGAAAEAALGRQSTIEPTILGMAAKEAEELKRVLPEIQNRMDKFAMVLQAPGIESTPPGALAKLGFDKALAEYTEKSERLKGLSAQIAGARSRSIEAESSALGLESRKLAQRDVDLAKLITAIGQLENVMRVVVQQRVPSSPGSTVIRGGP